MSSVGLTWPAIWFMVGLWAFIGSTTLAAFLYWLGDRPKRRGLLDRGLSWTPVCGWICGGMLLGKPAFVAMMAIAALWALRECLTAAQYRPSRPVAAMIAALALAPFATALFAPLWVTLVVLPVAIALVVPVLVLATEPATAFLARTALLATTLWWSAGIVSATALLHLTPDWINPGGGASGLILFTIAVTQFNDLWQYFTGKAFGRRPLAPEISPGKTWEGFIGGLVITTAMGAGFGGWLICLPPLWSAAATAVLCVTGLLGDLLVSAFKRSIGVKDLGDLLPGFGGILDRTDSLVLNVPLVWLVLARTGPGSFWRFIPWEF